MPTFTTTTLLYESISGRQWFDCHRDGAFHPSAGFKIKGPPITESHEVGLGALFELVFVVALFYMLAFMMGMRGLLLTATILLDASAFGKECLWRRSIGAKSLSHSTLSQKLVPKMDRRLLYTVLFGKSAALESHDQAIVAVNAKNVA